MGSSYQQKEIKRAQQRREEQRQKDKRKWWRERDDWAAAKLNYSAYTTLSATYKAKLKADEFKANNWLREHADNLQKADLYLPCNDSELVSWCEKRVTECKGHIHDKASREQLPVALWRCFWVLDRYGIEPPLAKSPIGGPSADLWPLAARLMCPKWWRRKARQLQAREVDQYARKRGQVAKYKQAYCSDWLIKNRRKADKRNAEMLESTTAVNELGQEYTLLELAGTSTANLANRRNELMTRISGFETVAERRGHAAEFWTFTLTGEWHRMRWIEKAKKAVKIKKWTGTTPREAQARLCQQWQRIRAAFDKAGIRCYGFRVVEPHHDGTPHWHLMLFFEPQHIKAARQIAADKVAGGSLESPAFDYKAIDPAKGTASGYIAKYIAKNIDGQGVHGALRLQDDDSGLAMTDGAERVRAWASGWGIRQFQQVGGPSVTVWRELRRLWATGDPSEGELLGSSIAEQAGQAADAGDWAAYVEAMGGANLPRDSRPLAPAYWHEEKLDTDTGEIKPAYETTEYGDPATARIFGVLMRAAGYLLTRVHEWRIVWQGASREPPEWKPAPIAAFGRLGLV